MGTIDVNYSNVNIARRINLFNEYLNILFGFHGKTADRFLLGHPVYRINKGHPVHFPMVRLLIASSWATLYAG